MEVPQIHPIYLTVTGAHALNVDNSLTKQSWEDSKAVEQKDLHVTQNIY